MRGAAPCTKDKAVAMEFLLPNHRRGPGWGLGGSLFTTGQDGRQGQGPRCRALPTSRLEPTTHVRDGREAAHWRAAKELSLWHCWPGKGQWQLPQHVETRTCTPRPGILMDGVVQAEPQLQPWPASWAVPVHQRL